MTDTDFMLSEEYFAWCVREHERCIREKLQREEEARLRALRNGAPDVWPAWVCE